MQLEGVRASAISARNEAPTAARGTSSRIAGAGSGFGGRAKNICRMLGVNGLYHTGLLRAMRRVSHVYELEADPARYLPRWRKAAGPKFAILCYHRIGLEGIPFFSALSPEEFEKQVRFLCKHYRLVSLDQLWRDLQGSSPVEQTVAITFDDGYRDLFTYAFPILQRYCMPATVFLVVGAVESGEVPWYDRVFVALRAAPGGTTDLLLDRPRRFALTSPASRLQAAWEIVCYLRNLPDWLRREFCAALEKRFPLPAAELSNRMLTWDQVRAMRRAGISFGSHTMTHPVISRLEPAQLQQELIESKRILEERLGSPALDFAYPFGKLEDCGPRATEMLEQCGYRLAVTTVEGINTRSTHRYELRRLQIGEGRPLATFGFELSRAFLSREAPRNGAAQPGSERVEAGVRPRSKTGAP